MSDHKKYKKEKNTGMFDYTLLFIVLFLLCFGLVMLYSVSSYEANLKFGDSAYYLKKQLFATVFGIVVLFITTMVNYHIWDKVPIIAYLISLGLIWVFTEVLNLDDWWMRLSLPEWMHRFIDGRLFCSLFATVICIFVNFILNKLFVFKGENEKNKA